MNKTLIAKGLAVLAAPLTVFTLSAHAGQIELTTGDKLTGELVAVGADKLVWKSPTFGEVSIKKSKVASLQTSTPLKINGHKKPCFINGLAQGVLSYRCDDGDVAAIQLLSLDNVETFAAFASGAYEYEGKLSLAGTYSDGNKDEEDWDFNTRTSFRRGELRHVTELKYESESTDGGPTIEEYDASYRLDWFFKEKWFWYNEAGFGADDSKNLDEHYQLGTGIGNQVWKTHKGHLDLELGALYTKDYYDPTADDLLDPDFEDKDEHVSLRYATDFKYVLEQFRKSSLFHRNELVYSMEDSDDWEFSADTGINIPLGAGLFSELMFEYDYDNQPSGENEKTDTKLSVGVGYKW